MNLKLAMVPLLLVSGLAFAQPKPASMATIMSDRGQLLTCKSDCEVQVEVVSTPTGCAARIPIGVVEAYNGVTITWLIVDKDLTDGETYEFLDDGLHFAKKLNENVDHKDHFDGQASTDPLRSKWKAKNKPTKKGEPLHYLPLIVLPTTDGPVLCGARDPTIVNLG